MFYNTKNNLLKIYIYYEYLIEETIFVHRNPIFDLFENNLRFRVLDLLIETAEYQHFPVEAAGSTANSLQRGVKTNHYGHQPGSIACRAASTN